MLDPQNRGQRAAKQAHMQPLGAAERSAFISSYTALHRAAAGILMHQAQSKNSLPPPSVVPNTSTPPTTTTFIPSLSIALYHCCNLLICRAAESPGHSASSQLFTFQKLTSEIVFCFPGWGFVLGDSSDARNKGLLDQKRKKGLCCHFHFCIAQPAGILVVCLFFALWDVLKIDLVLCCFRTTEVYSRTHCLALSGIQLL